MACDEKDAFFAAMRASAQEQKRTTTSDDIIEFIKANWKMFTYRRSDMMEAVNQLGSSVPYTVDALCDQLGLPDNVYFKRVKVADVGAAVLNFKTNAVLLPLFRRCCEMSSDNTACLVIVAGQKSVCITNMQTTVYPDSMIIYYKDTDDTDIHIFKFSEAALRLPNVFNRRYE